MIRPRVICDTCQINEHADDDECSCPWWGATPLAPDRAWADYMDYDSESSPSTSRRRALIDAVRALDAE